ncbi:Uncharacterised protein [Mycobacterium tuberculosis]|nr:Uncharacterised protein [Mycobacterium tuberculosis]
MVSRKRTTLASAAPGLPCCSRWSSGPGIRRRVAASSTAAWCAVRNRYPVSAETGGKTSGMVAASGSRPNPPSTVRRDTGAVPNSWAAFALLTAGV